MNFKSKLYETLLKSAAPKKSYVNEGSSLNDELTEDLGRIRGLIDKLKYYSVEIDEIAGDSASVNYAAETFYDNLRDFKGKLERYLTENL